MLGTDIIEIRRIKEAAQKESFLAGVYTPAEREYYSAHGNKAETLAGMFCAKEAVAKALGTGFCGFRPNDVEILHTETGAPYVRLMGKAKKLFPHVRLEISVSHCNEYATAVALGTDSCSFKKI